MSVAMDRVNRAYAEFRERAEEAIADRITFVEARIQQESRSLEMHRKACQEIPGRIAAYEAELDRLQRTSVPENAPLIVGEQREDGSLVLSVPANATAADVARAAGGAQ